MAAFQDLTGKRFNRLVANKVVSKTPTRWKCTCDCGNTTEATTMNLNSGSVKSCGCLSRENTGKLNSIHGMTDSKEHRAWQCVKQRCFYEKHGAYKYYGGRGITMSDNLANNFMEFYKEIGEYPNDGNKYSVERIDNKMGYIEGNITWIKIEKQARNKNKREDNTSGSTGVNWNWDRVTGKKLCAVVTWYMDGKKKSKSFSAAKYGLLPAFSIAVLYREDRIKELNKLGYDYSETHGK